MQPTGFLCCLAERELRGSIPEKTKAVRQKKHGSNFLSWVDRGLCLATHWEPRSEIKQETPSSFIELTAPLFRAGCTCQRNMSIKHNLEVAEQEGRGLP